MRPRYQHDLCKFKYHVYQDQMLPWKIKSREEAEKPERTYLQQVHYGNGNVGVVMAQEADQALDAVGLHQDGVVFLHRGYHV